MQFRLGEGSYGKNEIDDVIGLIIVVSIDRLIHHVSLNLTCCATFTKSCGYSSCLQGMCRLTKGALIYLFTMYINICNQMSESNIWQKH